MIWPAKYPESRYSVFRQRTSSWVPLMLMRSGSVAAPISPEERARNGTGALENQPERKNSKKWTGPLISRKHTCVECDYEHNDPYLWLSPRPPSDGQSDPRKLADSAGSRGDESGRCAIGCLLQDQRDRFVLRQQLLQRRSTPTSAITVRAIRWVPSPTHGRKDYLVSRQAL